MIRAGTNNVLVSLGAAKGSRFARFGAFSSISGGLIEGASLILPSLVMPSSLPCKELQTLQQLYGTPRSA